MMPNGGDVCIYAGEPRGREQEAKVALTSKCEFAGCAFPVGELQRALGVSPGGNPGELRFGELLRIAREKPQSPTAPPLYGFDAEGISGTQPLIASLEAINYGIAEEVLLPSSERYPVLSKILEFLQANGCEFRSVEELAGQIAPALNVSGQWDDPIVRRSENTWKEAKIEGEQYLPALKSQQGTVLAVRDLDGFIRHLILKVVIDGKAVIVPLTFAQHPQYRQPMVCYFAFSPRWWLIGSEQLKMYPEAELWITNDIYCTDSVISADPKRIFLSYFFGKEMIPHLELVCLLGRNVTVMVELDPIPHETRRNVEEAILLMSRLKSMDIKVEFKVVDKSAPTYHGTAKYHGDLKLPDVISLYSPRDVTIEQVVMMAKAHRIEIPENLRPDRYGALDTNAEQPIVKGFINTGEVTGITIHTGVDITLVACSIVHGLRSGAIFSGKWSCCKNVHPVLFIMTNTAHRHNAIFAKFTNTKFPIYEIPCGNKEKIENNLYHIVKENGFNVFVFEARQIVSEYKKELQIACEWAQKHRIGVVVITSEEDLAAATFFSDISGRDIHFWWSEKIKHEYIVEDRPLLFGDASAFKIMLNRHGWSVQEHAEDELRTLKDRNVTILHQQSENENIKSTDPIMQYRRS